MTQSEEGTNNRPIPIFVDDGHLCTKRLETFHRRQKDVFDLFLFGISLATKTDENRLIAARALAKTGGEEDQKALKEIESNPGPAFERLRKFSTLQSENLIIRITDNFLCYLSEIIQDVLRKKPEILRSKETLRFDEILGFSNYKELLSYLVDKKINELSYSGIDGVSEFLNSRTNLKLTEREGEYELLVIGIELRNAYTHTRGVISRITVDRLAKVDHNLPIKQGERFHPDFDLICQVGNNFLEIANRLDERFSNKFKIRRKKFSKSG